MTALFIAALTGCSMASLVWSLIEAIRLAAFQEDIRNDLAKANQAATGSESDSQDAPRMSR